MQDHLKLQLYQKPNDLHSSKFHLYDFEHHYNVNRQSEMREPFGINYWNREEENGDELRDQTTRDIQTETME